MPQSTIDTSKRPEEQRLAPVSDDASWIDPERILKEHARTSFSLATRLLPEAKRRETTLLYAFFRTLDDAVDEISHPSERAEAREMLMHWKAWSETPGTPPPNDDLGGEIDRIIATNQVPRQVLSEFIDGMLFDLDEREIRDPADLNQHCYRVASTVGIVMCHILGARQAAAVQSAANLGAAMQMTNILRDIGEDLARDRVYIPTSTLSNYGLDRAGLHQLVGHSNAARRTLAPMMQAEIHRTRDMYSAALPGIWLLPRESRMSILLAARLYRHLLSIIESNGYDSINVRAATSKWDKAREFVTCATITRLWKYDDGDSAGRR